MTKDECRESTADPPKVQLRERNKERTHLAMRSAALDLFLTQGFDETTVDEIVERAGVSRRSLFRYFPTKDDLVFSNLKNVADRLRRDAMETPADVSALVAAQRVLIALSSDIESDQIISLGVADLIAAHSLLRARSLDLRATWESGLADGLVAREERKEFPAPEPEVRLAAQVAMATQSAAFDEWRECRGKVNLSQLVERKFASLSRIVCESREGADG